MPQATLGTRSIGYLMRLLKPVFDANNIEESFAGSSTLPGTNVTTPDQVDQTRSKKQCS